MKSLKSFKKDYPDAMQMVVRHKSYSVSEDDMIEWAMSQWNVPINILQVKVGKSKSCVILSFIVNK